MGTARVSSILVLSFCACSPAAGSDPLYWGARPNGALAGGGNAAALGGGGDTGAGGSADPAGGASGSGDTALGAGGAPAMGVGGNAAIGAGGSGDPATGAGGSPAVGAGGNPTVGAGGAGAGPGAGGTGAGATGPGNVLPTGGGPCVTVSFTTVDDGGQFGPNNVGAIWITTSGGKFVKTLDVWAAKRAIYLKAWIASSGGNKVDAISSATASSPGARTATWNCKDLSGNVVPPGDYVAHGELTEDDFAGPNTSMPFTLTIGQPLDTMYPNEKYFLSRHVSHPQ